MSWNIEFSGLSDIGLVRSKNEDVWAKVPGREFYILADGMGGHNAGDVAAKDTVSLLCNRFKDYSCDVLEDFVDDLISSIVAVNNKIHDKGHSDSSLYAMGTTVCCLGFCVEKVVCAHLGDSRIYRMRKGRLEHLTRDHSLLNDLIDSGKIGDDEIENFKRKHVLSKALGLKRFEVPDVDYDDCKEGDMYLMCSDGLSDYVSWSKIQKLLKKGENLDVLCRELVDAAKNSGGDDNITVVLLRVM